MAAALLGVVEGQKDLGDGDAVAGERLLIGMGEADLPGRGGGLFFLEAQAAAGEAEMAPAHGDRAGGDEDYLLAATAATRDVVCECCEPRAADLAAFGDQE